MALDRFNRFMALPVLLVPQVLIFNKAMNPLSVIFRGGIS